MLIILFSYVHLHMSNHAIKGIHSILSPDHTCLKALLKRDGPRMESFLHFVKQNDFLALGIQFDSLQFAHFFARISDQFAKSEK